MKAKELLQKGHKAIVFFTRGSHFKIMENGQAKSGNWKINKKRNFNKVIIYKRELNADNAEIYLGDYLEILPSNESGRSIIVFDNVKNIGTTDFTWKEFCGGSQNPIRYIEYEE